MGDFESTGALVLPRKPRKAIVGVPASLLAQVDGPLNFENFLGVETASRSAEQYFTTATGGSVFTSASQAPPAADTRTRGLWQLTLTDDPVAPKGVTRRQELNAIADDGFGADFPTLWAIRYRANSVKPTAATYVASVGGLFTFASSSGSATDGVEIIFDPTLGIDAWVCRASRAGVSIQSVPLERWDAAFHTMGFLHRGTEITPFMDGAVQPSFTGPEIQPALDVRSNALRLLTLAAGGVTGDLSADWVLWGS